MQIVELAQQIYVITTDSGDSRGDSNFGLITYGEGAVLIDNDVRRFDEMIGLIRQVTDKPVRLLINTHDGYDHTSANTLLAREGTIIISSPACRSIMASQGRKSFLEKMAADPGLRDKYGLGDLALPDITVPDSLTLHLGARTAQVSFAGWAHTPGDVTIYFPDEQILFAGDILFNECHPVTTYGNTAEWIRVLERIGTLPVRLTVPGHGPVANGRDNIDSLRQYFLTFRARVADLVARKVPVDEAHGALDLREYEDWGKKNWLPASVKRIYSELQGQQ
ncbi:MAG: MBL fold metallo-hydrolase [Chloroflexi bacterium]|nr:MBL fold metallo-hydrolase [Chloroflexota bacterium]